MSLCRQIHCLEFLHDKQAVSEKSIIKRVGSVKRQQVLKFPLLVDCNGSNSTIIAIIGVVISIANYTNFLPIFATTMFTSTRTTSYSIIWALKLLLSRYSLSQLSCSCKAQPPLQEQDVAKRKDKLVPFANNPYHGD
jgi:hypothetical protein